MTQLDVLHLNQFKVWRGGENQTWLLLKGLHERGVKTGLGAAKDGLLAKKARAAGIPVFDLDFRSLRCELAIRELLRFYKVKIVHAHHFHLWNMAFGAATGLNVKTVGTRRIGARLDYPEGFGPIRQALYRYKAHRYVAISQYVQNVLIKEQVAPADIRLVYSGVDPGRFRDLEPCAVEKLKREFSLYGKGPFLTQIAAIEPEKGQEVLIKALPELKAKFPGLVVFLVGEIFDQAYLGRLQSIITGNNLQSAVIITGPRRNPGAFMALCHILVMSTFFEGLGTVVLDALAMGKPVAVSDGGAMPEIVDDGVNGRTFTEGDPASLAAVLFTMLNDYPLSLAMAGRGLPERFNAEAMINGNLRVYRELCPALDH